MMHLLAAIFFTAILIVVVAIVIKTVKENDQ